MTPCWLRESRRRCGGNVGSRGNGSRFLFQHAFGEIPKHGVVFMNLLLDSAQAVPPRSVPRRVIASGRCHAAVADHRLP